MMVPVWVTRLRCDSRIFVSRSGSGLRELSSGSGSLWGRRTFESISGASLYLRVRPDRLVVIQGRRTSYSVSKFRDAGVDGAISRSFAREVW
jgi:hypothetical protein